MSRGHDRERAVKKLLEDDGWWVTRAAGSLGDADLVALRAGEPARLVEVKANVDGGPYMNFRGQDRAELSAAAVKAGAEAWLAYWPPRKPLVWIAEAEWPSRSASPAVDPHI